MSNPEAIRKENEKLKDEISGLKRQVEESLNETTRIKKELSELLRAANSILETHNFTITAREIFEACRRTIGAKAGYVALLSADGQENELLFLEDGGLPCTVNPDLGMPIRGLRAECYKSGKVVYDNDFMNGKWIRFMPKGHVVLKNVLFAPLNIKGKTVGIMGISNKESDFTENDARIAAAFGEYAAIALLNSRNIDALEKHAKELQELNTTKDKLFSVISHDLRSPFTSILGLADTIREQVREKNFQQIEEYSELILQASQNTYELLENLLNWSRLQKKTISFRPEWFNVFKVIQNIAVLMQEHLHTKNIQLNVSVDKQLKIFGDQQLIEIVIRNLVSNAIKFTPAKGNIDITASRSRDTVEFSVSDNGVGIQKVDLDKLFMLESSFSTTGTHQETGTGLGLILCKEFVAMHKGTIHVTSEYGKGSIFTFSIPAQ